MKSYTFKAMAFDKCGKQMSTICAVALGVAIMVGAATRSDASQLILNGGFEDGSTTQGVSIVPNSWTPNAGYTSEGYNIVTTDPNNIYSGSHALQIGNFTYQPVPSLSQTFTDVNGATYNGQLFVAYGGNGSSSSTGAFFDALIDNNIVLALDPTAAGIYTSYLFSFVGTGSDTLTLQGNTNPSEWFVDNVTVNGAAVGTTPLPSTWLMLLGGLAGLCFVGYRSSRNGSAAVAAA